MSQFRLDLGPRLRRTLTRQPTARRLGHDRMCFVPDYEGGELKLAAQLADPRHGPRKIADLPRACTSLHHNPPSLMVYEPGVWEHVCPDCGARQVFTVDGPVW